MDTRGRGLAGKVYAALLSGGRGWILVAVAGGWLLAIGVRLAFPAVLPSVRAAFGLSLTQTGVLLTVLWVAYAAGQFPGGVLRDWAGDRIVLAGSLAIAAGTLGIIVLSQGYWWFVAGTVMFGLATGLFSTTRFTVITDVYPDREGAALGVTSAAGNVGTTTLPVVAGFLAVAGGWRLGIGFALPLFLVMAAAQWRVIPARRGATGTGRGSVRDSIGLIRRAVSRRSVVLGAGSMFLFSLIYQSFTGFFPTYLVTVKGFGQEAAAVFLGVFFASGILVQPTVGALGDRYGARRVLSVVSLVTAAALVGVPLVNHAAGVLVLTVAASVQLGFWPIAQGYVVNAFPDAVQGSGFGLVRMVYIMLAATGPTFVGWLADAGFFDGAVFALAGVAVVAAVICGNLPAVARERDPGDE